MQKFILSLVLALVAAGLFGRVTGADFIWNDRTIALESETPSPAALHSGELYAPVTKFAWQGLSKLAKKFAKPETAVLHAANLVAHVTSAVLVFLILALVLQNAPAAFFGGLLFALHPLQVEAVAYVAALDFPLGAAFALFAILEYLRFSQLRETQTRGRSANPLNAYYVATASYALAVLCMPALIVTPLVALLLERLLPRRSSFLAPRRPVWPLAIWALLAVPQLIWTILSQKTAALSAHLPFWIKPVVAADALSFYLSKIFAPAFLGPDYGRSPAFLASQWWGFVTWILPATLFLILLYWREKARTWYAAAFAVLILGLLPFLGFALFEAQGTSTVANRYVYFAMLGPALGLAYAMTTPKKAWIQLLGLAAVVACGYLSFQSLKHWRSDETLWSHAVQVNPGSPIAHEVLGHAAREKGEWRAAREHYEKVLQSNAVSAEIHFHLAEIERLHGSAEKAIPLYEKTLTLDSSYARAYGSLGLALLAGERFDEAQKNFEKAVEIEPNDYEAVKNLGLLHVRKKEYAEGAPLLRRALTLAEERNAPPTDRALIHALLGLALANTNQTETAREHLALAVKLEPNNQEAHRVLADIYFAAEQRAEALPHYQKAVELGDASPEAANNLGIILSMNKSYEKAAEAFDKALVAKPNFPEALTNLGVANFHLRRFEAANKAFETSLGLKPQQADPYYFFGDMARWQGKEKEAIGFYYKALKINPSHVDANYRLGNWFMKEGNSRMAARHYQVALKVAPEDQRLIFSLKKAEGSSGEEKM